MVIQILGERIKTEGELFIENFNKLLRDNADEFTKTERDEISVLNQINEASLVKFNDYVKEEWNAFFNCIIDESYTLESIMFVVIEKYMLDYKDCIVEITNNSGVELMMQKLKEDIARCELEESLKKQSTINMVKMPIGLFPAGIVQCLKEIEKENQKEECAVQKEVNQLCVSEIINEIVSAMSDIGVDVKVPGHKVKKEEEIVRCKVPAWAIGNSAQNAGQSIQSFYEKLMSLK